MNLVIKELDNIKTDTERRIENSIDAAYKVTTRGEAPVGTSWNTSEKDELKVIYKDRDTYEKLLEEIEEALDILNDTF